MSATSAAPALRTAARSSVLSAALALAARGVRVFPFGPDKKPLPGQCHAQSVATTDPGTIEAAFLRWPDAALHALTGAREDGGLGVVIDLDAKHGNDGFAALRQLEGRLGITLPETLTCTTPSGGEHRHFLWPGGVVRNTDSELGPGIDTKGTRGSIVMPPTRRTTGVYAWRDVCVPVAALPEEFVALLREKRRPAPPAPRPAVACGSAYARAALAAEVANIAAAGAGMRQAATNRAAYSIGTLVGAGALWFDEAERSLVDAALSIAVDASFTPRTAVATVRRGLRDGAARPRVIVVRSAS